MTTRRRFLGSAATALTALPGVAAADGVGFPLGAPWRRDAPHRDVRVAAADGTLYVVASDGEETVAEAVDGVDGATLWRTTVGAPARGAVATADALWIADDRPRLHRLGGADGTARTVARRTVGSMTRPFPIGDAVAVGHDLPTGGGPLAESTVRGVVRVVGADGQRWSHRHLGPVGRPVGDGSGVYVAVIHGDSEELDAGRVFGHGAGNGDRLWSSGDVRATGALAVAAGVVAAGGADGTVRGLDAAGGDEAWRVDVADGAVAHLAAGPRDDEVVAAADDGTAVGIATGDGTPLWRYRVDGGLDGIAVHGDAVYLLGDGELRALQPHDGGVAWRGGVGYPGWPPAVVDGAVVLPGDGAIVIYPGGARAADRRIAALDDSPLRAIDPVASVLGYDDVRGEAVAADDRGDHHAAYEAAGRARRRRRIAAGLVGLVGLGVLGSGVYAGDRLRLRWRRYRTLLRRHGRVADRIEALEDDRGVTVPPLHDALREARPGPLDDPDEARDAVDEVGDLAETAETVAERRSRLRGRVEPLEDRFGDRAPLGEAVSAVVEAVDAAALGGAEQPRDLRRGVRRLRDAEELAAALEAVDRGALERTFPLQDPPLEGIRPDRVEDAIRDADGLEEATAAVDRLASVVDDVAGDADGDAAMLRRVGDDALREAYVAAVRTGDVERLTACRERLRRRADVAERRDGLVERLDDRDAVGGVPMAPLREALDGVGIDDVEAAETALDTAERALDAAERLADLADRDLPLDADGLRDALTEAVRAGEDDAVAGAARDVERTADIADRAAEALAALDDLVLAHADRDRDDVADAVAEAVADRDRHRLDRIADELRRAEERRWTTRRVAGLDDEGFAGLVADLWASLGWETEARWSDAVVAEDGDETLLIATYPYAGDRTVQRRDVEHQLDRRRTVGADRLLVVTTSEASSGARATAEHGWRDVAFLEGDELVELLDGSPIVPPT